MLVIFDLNRTLYDPERRALYADWTILKSLKQKSELWLWSVGDRNWDAVLGEFGTDGLFSKKIFPKKKSTADFIGVADQDSVYLVSDYFEDIEIGNEMKFQTVWIRRGKFRNMQPRTKPKYVITRLIQLRNIIK
jgi:FMN phosphatase YigB (HAD superfamily)